MLAKLCYDLDQIRPEMANEWRTMFPLPPGQVPLISLRVFPTNFWYIRFSRFSPAASRSVETCLPSLAELLLSRGDVFPKIFPSEMPVSGMVPGSVFSFPDMAVPHLQSLCPAETQELPTPYRVCWALEVQGRARSFCLPQVKSKRPAVAHVIASFASATS